jgi:hypothetical protein
MDPRSWVDQLFTYGPYAVLALFALWVAPAQLKAFRQGPHGSPLQQMVSGFVTVGCWLIVFAMVFYIYLFWPPRTVYLGSLGTHPGEAQFISRAPKLFVSARPMGGNRLRWDYVVVSDARPGGAGNEDEAFEFTYQWTLNANNQADFSFLRSDLKKRRIDLKADPERPEVLLYDDDDNSTTPPRPLPRLAGARPAAVPAMAAALASAVVAAAHAETRQPIDKPVLLDWLSSPAGYLRAQGRGQLRQLSSDELRQLQQTPGLNATAREQIDAEVSRRR